MEDKSLKYDHQYDKMDLEDIAALYFELKKLNYPYDSPEYTKLRLLKMAMDCKRGYGECKRQ